MLFWFGRSGVGIGLAGVALCHDVLIALALTGARRRLGLAGLTAMLAAHVGLTFKIVFTGHAGSMRSRGIGSVRL
jgi:nucleoside phosphorylase